MPLLFQTRRLQIPLTPGVPSYTLPSNVVAPLDAFVRQYFTGNAVNFLPAFTAPVGSRVWNVLQPQHGLRIGQMVYYPTQIEAGGIIISGAYIVTSIVDPNNYEITTTEPSSGTGVILTNDQGIPLTSDDGQILTDGSGLYPPMIPVMTATADSDIVNVALPAHGQFNGATWYVNVNMTLGGTLINAGCTVVAVQDENNFSIQIPQDAIFNDVQLLNGGMAQAQTELYNDNHVDFILYPLSRTEYAMQPDKQIQYRPTTFWFDRQINPRIVFWNVPDNNGPYIMNLWVMQQPDDAVVEGGVGVGVPFRWFDAFCAGLALRLCRKFPPAPQSGTVIADLRAEYQAALQSALKEDIERVPLMVTPGLTSYFR